MSASALKGMVERYVSAPREDGYAIVSIRLPNGRRASICGPGLGGLTAGQDIEATGSWTTHPRYGDQFRATGVRDVVPDDLAGLRKWLVRTGIPGVGEATARRLVETFGTDVIRAIAASEPRAAIILGHRFEDARKAMAVTHAERTCGPLLAQCEVAASVARRIFEHYGEKSEAVLRGNPYRLICDVDGIAFATADRIAALVGVTLDGRSRLQAAAVDALRRAADDGHTAVPAAVLAKAAAATAKFPVDDIHELMSDVGDDAVVATTLESDGAVIDAYALSHIDRTEQRLARRIAAKTAAPAAMTETVAARFVGLAVDKLNVGKAENERIVLNAEQRLAAETALSSPISILTGGPGTGKTFVLKIVTTAWALASAAGMAPHGIALAAPTGKASQRMKESTGLKSKTLHRLLEAGGEGFRRDGKNPLDGGLIAIDETSMKDVFLAAAFARAWGDATILLIGDGDQLASVGPGRVLGDLIDSGAVPVTRLDKIRRQAAGSAIAEGAQAIREGRMPAFDAHSDLTFVAASSDAEAADYAERIHAAYRSDGADVQLLTPGHKADTGTVEMNRRLQAAAGLTGPSVRIGGGIEARVGELVIQSENCKELEVFNGDTGTIVSIQAGTAKVAFGDRTVDMDAKALRMLALAYALTVHKSQGSEYDVVIMPVTRAHFMLLRRTLLYTGVTRAKTKCIIVGTASAIRAACANDDGRSRTTTLAWRLREAVAA